jgi:hypothetical protein
MVRPIIPDEVFNLASFYTENEETLFDFVPKECLPDEYGGTLGSIQKIKADYLEKLEAQGLSFTNKSSKLMVHI